MPVSESIGAQLSFSDCQQNPLTPFLYVVINGKKIQCSTLLHFSSSYST